MPAHLGSLTHLPSWLCEVGEGRARSLGAASPTRCLRAEGKALHGSARRGEGGGAAHSMYTRI